MLRYNEENKVSNYLRQRTIQSRGVNHSIRFKPTVTLLVLHSECNCTNDTIIHPLSNCRNAQLVCNNASKGNSQHFPLTEPLSHNKRKLHTFQIAPNNELPRNATKSIFPPKRFSRTLSTNCSNLNTIQGRVS